MVVVYFLGLGSTIGKHICGLQDIHGSIGKQPMSHYNFCKAIALAWIDPTTYWPDRMKKMHILQEQWMTGTQTTSASTTVKEMMSVNHPMTGPHGAVSDRSQVQGQCKQME